ncbi:hypothetical protein BB8028_0006g09310 [Beauveria bassiana]|uniref:Secreted protein n=1 Tax=Beauveria bassiana TaxID=176275 RepID=A0A2S7YLA0_BEABA|nr:hypothetical protein BB8028_0006g09310 [Beauveria bassiana]
MRLPTIAGVFLLALPVQAGLVSFAVPKTIKADDDITVMITMNSEQGYVWDYTLLLSATDKSLPPGYLGGRGFAMIDLRGLPFGTSNWTISTRGAGVGAHSDSVIRGVWLSTVGVMGFIKTQMREASIAKGNETSSTYVDSEPLHYPH